MKTGDTARLIQPAIVGKVKERRITKDGSDRLEFLLEWTDPVSGELTDRWFDEGLLEVIPPATPQAPAGTAPQGDPQ